MSCRERSTVPRLGLGDLGDAERVRMLEHIDSCADCRHALEVLQRTESLLEGEGPPELTPETKRRLWTNIDAAVAPAPFWVKIRAEHVATFAALAASVALLLFLRSPLRTAPGVGIGPSSVSNAGPFAPAHVHLAAGAHWARGRLSVQAIDSSELQLREFDNLGEVRVLELERGAVTIDLAVVDTARTLRVVSPGAQLETIGARFMVAIDGAKQTSVRVDRGEVSRDGVRFQGSEAAGSEAAGSKAQGSEVAGSAVERSAAEEAESSPAVAKKKIARAIIAAPKEVNAEPGPKASAPEAQKDEAAPAPAESSVPATSPAVAAEKTGRIVEPGAAELLRAADALRRAGDLEAAARLYGEVAAHPLGDAYAEEAMLRQARILRRLGRVEEAKDVLLRARERFPDGELEPERRLEEQKN